VTADGKRLAVFAATSGHSGVDRVLGNLIRQFDAWGIAVDLLGVRGHGPHLPEAGLSQLRRIDLGTAHVYAALPALTAYLRRERPAALLTDKDRVNRTAILGRALARSPTRLAVRIGTTVSVNLASRGRLERSLQRASMRWLYPLADQVLAPSAGVADDLTGYTGLPRDHIRVVRSPIVTPDLARLSREPSGHPWLDADGEAPVVLGVGELGSRKDFQTLIRGFARVRAERPCRLVILGRGRRRDSLLRLAAELGVAADVDLPGFAANPYAAMARARVFVLSSRWEGMPVVLIEALACHTPAVATDCPSGPREILAGSPAGTLVPVGDPGAMAAAIADRLDRSVPAAAFEAAVAEYRVERSAAAYLEALGMARHRSLREA
jgi:glycosyltransferase involved in cell wall biosynthesis